MCKTIRLHPGVAEVITLAPNRDDHKYAVFLKKGWHFIGLDKLSNFSKPYDPKLIRVGYFKDIPAFQAAQAEQLKTVLEEEHNAH